jgi:hypothetical protein
MLRPSFAALRGESAVPTLLTLVVSAWFLAAGAAVLVDRGQAPAAAHAAASPVSCGAPLAAAPAIHETILVEARRPWPEAHETILVEAHRG